MSDEDGYFPPERPRSRSFNLGGKNGKRPDPISRTPAFFISVFGAGCSISGPLWNRWVSYKKTFLIPDEELLFQNLDFVFRDWPALLLAIAFLASVGFNVRVRHDNDFVCFLSAFGLPAMFVAAMHGYWQFFR